MPRPRADKKDLSIPNLYRVHTRSGGVRYRYKNVLNGKFTMLRTRDHAEAERKARHLNAIIAQRMIDQEAQQILEAHSAHRTTVGEWLDQYIEIQADKLKHGEIKRSTYDNRRWKGNAIRRSWGDLPLAQLTTVRIAELIKRYTRDGKARMGQAVRSMLVDLFDEAIAAGAFPADKPNPARVTKAPRVRIKRARLTLAVFRAALAWAEQNQPRWAVNAYRLALLTAQRREDIAGAQFTHIQRVDGRDYLEFVQGKTGTRIRIDLDLRLNTVGLSLREVVTSCRDRVVSRFLVHHHRHAGQAKPGAKVRPTTLQQLFAEAVRSLDLNWGENDPPSFHEIRSLSERLYREQGEETQALLGHKHQSMTDTYHDARGHDWLVVKAR